MGCGASKAWSGAAYSTTMLKKFHQQAAVAELEKTDRDLAHEVVALRKHTNTERQRLMLRIAEARQVNADGVEELRGEIDGVRSALEAFKSTEHASLRWELSASSSHVGHLGARLADCREHRDQDQQRSAEAIAAVRRECTAQIAALTERVEAAQRHALAAEAAQQRAETDAEARAAEARERAAETAAVMEESRAKVAAVMAEKIRAVETADMLFGIAQARAAAAEAKQLKAEEQADLARAQATEFDAIRGEAMKSLHDHITQEELREGRAVDRAKRTATEELDTVRLQARLEASQQTQERTQGKLEEQRAKTAEAEGQAMQWAYRVAAVEGPEVVSELGYSLPEPEPEPGG